MKKSDWIPPDSVALIFRIKKEIMDNTSAKYFQLRLFRAYKSDLMVKFTDNPALNTSFPIEEKRKDNWAIVKAYFPLTSNIQNFKGAMKKDDGSIYDRIGIEVPDKFPVEIDLPGIWFKDLCSFFRNHILDNLKFMMRTFKPNDDNKSKQSLVLLTDSNWSVADKEPAPNKTVMYNFKEGKPESMFAKKTQEDQQFKSLGTFLERKK